MADRKSIARLAGIMAIIVLAGILVARSFYGRQNRRADPRVIPARELYGTYNRVALTGDYPELFALLDRVDSIYLSIPHYRKSFERGVLANNRAAAYLTLALYRDSVPRALGGDYLMSLSNDSLVYLARKNVLMAIELYQDWFRTYASLNPGEIREEVSADFFTGLAAYDHETGLDGRIKEIEQALREHPRRMSVCHSNLGLIYRLSGDYEKAVEEYERALELWDRNLEAENNLNRLLGRPLKKRNFIQRMFPPDREETN